MKRKILLIVNLYVEDKDNEISNYSRKYLFTYITQSL